MKRLRFLWMMLLLFLPWLYADVHINENGIVGTGSTGAIHVNQDLHNDGQFVYAHSHIRFFGEGTSNVLGSSGLYVRRLVLDKNSDSFLYLLEPVGVSDSLLLLSGTMDCPGSRSQSAPVTANVTRRDQVIAQKEITQSFEQSKTRKKSARKAAPRTGIAESMFSFESSSRVSERQPLNVTERDGSMTLADQATIRVGNGSMEQSPSLNGGYHLIYRNQVTTGAELVSDPNALRKLTVDLPEGTLTLDKNAWINQALIVDSGLLDTGGFTLTMGEFAPVVGYPDDIIGNLTGTAVDVGTNSYSNSTFLFYIGPGTTIGNLYPLVFTEPELVGPSQSIKRQWFLDSDIAPNERNMQFAWYASEDNGLDLSSVQLWRSDSRAQWFAFGHPLDMSGSGSLRVLTAYDVSEFGWWEIAPALFDLSETAIHVGDIPVGETTVTSFTITNLTDDNQYGYVFTPDWITAELATRTRAARKLERQPDNDRNETDRSYQYYSVGPSSVAEITLHCAPQTPGDFSETINVRMTSNGYPTRVLSLSGRGIMPDIDVSPTAVEETLAQDETQNVPVTIENVGLLQLDYSIDCGTVLLNTSFDGNFPPNGWETQTLEGAGTWEQAFTAGHTDRWSACANWRNLHDSRLITPSFDVSSTTELSYWIRSQDIPYYGGMFNVEITTDGYHWTGLDSFNQNTLTQQFEHRTLDLSSYSGSTVRLAFHAWDNFEANGVYLDDILVKDTEPVSWLSIDSSTGSITPHGYDTINIQLDTIGLSDGAYTSGLLIESNDPLESLLSIPITMNVQTATCQVTTSEIDFGTVILGENSFGHFTIHNTGNATLEGNISAPDTYDVSLHSRSRISRREDTEDRFESTREILTISVPAGESRNYSTTFTPNAIGDFEDVLTITHNAPGSPDEITLISSVITVPTVITSAVTNIGTDSAIVSGEVAQTGGTDVTARGICWDTRSGPTLDDDYTDEGSGTGTYSSTLSNLQPDTHYYARAYAINAAGTDYGIQLDFHTLALGPPSAPQDVLITVTESGIYLSWNEVTDAEEYAIYRVDDPSTSDWGDPIGTTAGTNWLDTEPLRNGMAFYRITAVRNVRPVILESSNDSVRK